MLNLGSAALKIFLALEPCDMRKSFNGLFELAQRHHDSTPGRDSLFVFTNKNRNRIKLLYFDGTGLWVAANRHAPQCAYRFVFEHGGFRILGNKC